MTRAAKPGLQAGYTGGRGRSVGYGPDQTTGQPDTGHPLKGGMSCLSGLVRASQEYQVVKTALKAKKIGIVKPGQKPADTILARAALIGILPVLMATAVERLLAVGSECVDRQRAFGEALGELRQILLRQAEEHRDRLHLGDYDDADGVLRLHQVAFVDQTDAGAAGDRRDDVGIGEIARALSITA